MSKLEYLNPNDWSLHVINGESECAPEEWVLVPDGAEILIEMSKSNKPFYKNGFRSVWNDKSWVSTVFVEDNLKIWKSANVLWRRKMKEYLVERNGKYELVEAYHLDGGIEVPDKADCLTKVHGFLTFWDGDFKSKTIGHLDFWCDSEKHPNLLLNKKEYFDVGGVEVLWQRKPSLNDKYAEIEEVCQDSNVSNPKHYTSHPSGIQCIEITRHHDFSIGNAIKYLWRAGLKDSDNEIQDLEKASWYIQDKIKQLKGGK